MAYLKHISFKSAARHLLFWAAYILYFIFNAGWHRGTWVFSFPRQVFTDVPIAIIICYLNLYLLAPVFYLGRKYLQYAVALLLLLLLGGTASFFLWGIWLPVGHAKEDTNVLPVGFWAIYSTQILPVVAAAMVLKLQRNTHMHEKTLRETEKEKFTAEMGLLKAQINPHFFFNTLNSLYALTLAGSDKSADMVMRLAEVMRFMLYETNADKVFLRDELKFLENYIGIEQTRFSERLDLSFRFSGDIKGKLITPLLLHPFVENAFKCCAENNSGWVIIDAAVNGGKLFFTVENTFASKTKDGNEAALANVKKRLELLYPQAYELQITSSNGVCRAELRLNL